MPFRIYNPAFDQLREELRATETELALSLSLFILFQVPPFPPADILVRCADPWRASL